MHFLTAAGWIVQDFKALNLGAGQGVAVREFQTASGPGGLCACCGSQGRGRGGGQARRDDAARGVRAVGQVYGGFPEDIPHVELPLPFSYESTGTETLFRGPARPGLSFAAGIQFPQAGNIAEWLSQPARHCAARLKELCQKYPLITTGLWDAQIEAIQGLEKSLAENRPRALIQMATGSGKTFTAVSFIYRLIKFAGAKRVLFLVDRNNLGKQTLREFQSYVTPDDGRMFTELYNVQRLTSRTDRPGRQGDHHHHPAAVLDAQGRRDRR